MPCTVDCEVGDAIPHCPANAPPGVIVSFSVFPVLILAEPSQNQGQLCLVHTLWSSAEFFSLNGAREATRPFPLLKCQNTVQRGYISWPGPAREEAKGTSSEVRQLRR
jgi:hypothetical protein